MAGYVRKESVQVAVIGLLAVTALAAGAATITSSVEPAFVGERTAPDAPQQDRGGLNLSENATTGDPRGDDSGTTGVTGVTTCISFLQTLPGVVVYFGAVGAVLVGLKRRFSLGTALFAFYGIAPVALLAYFLATDCAEFGGGGTGQGGESAVRGALRTAASSQIPLDVSPILLVGVLGVVLVVVGAVLYTTTGDQLAGTDEDDGGDAEEEADLRDLAAAAGEAADRLEEHNADVDNEVYRAWWEMTRMLDVPNPDTATPGEFAQAAIDLGVSEDDVAELTRLFEEVRYGRMDAESREELAIEVFRNIESEYGDGGSAARGSDADAGGNGGETGGR